MRVTFLSLIGIVAMAAQSCYYDNKEDLNQNLGSANCDTTNVTYSGTIQAIMATNCATSTVCHAGPNPSGIKDFTSYQEVKSAIDASGNGSLIGRITATTGSLMPQGGPKLPDCDIQKIQKWADKGAPNN